MKRIVLTSDKGGVGKSTSVANIAVRLVQLGKRVLCLDCDPQGDCSYILLGERPPLLEKSRNAAPSMYAVMAGDAEIAQAIVPASRYCWDDHAYLHVVGANMDLARAPLLLANDPGGMTKLKRALDGLPEDAYDYVLADTGKGLDLLVINALAATHYALVLATPGMLEIDAVMRTYDYVGRVREETLNHAAFPRVMGIVLVRADSNMAQDRATVAISAHRLLDETFPGLLFASTIPEAADYRKAVSAGLSIFEFEALQGPASDPEQRYRRRGGQLAVAYEQLVDEVIRHVS